MKIKSSFADFIVNPDGTIKEIIWTRGCASIRHRFLSEITRFDLSKFKEPLEEINILFVGYWRGDHYCRSIY
jgi:hypothetical protein